MNNQKKVSMKTTIAVMAVFAMSMTLGGITPIMAKLYEAFPDIPTSTVTYISSIASLISIPGSILVGMIAGKKLSMKKTILILVIIFIAGGCAPAFLSGFSAILVSRGILGFAMGGLSVIGNPLVTALYEENERPGILGISTFVSFAGNMVLQYFSSFLANFNWKLAFLGHALAVIPLILVLLFLPDEKAEAETSEKQNSGYHVPGKAWYVIIVFAIFGLFITPLLYMSSVYAASISTNSLFAASVSLMYSVGCLIAGLVFGKWYKIFKQYCMTVSALMAAGGMFLAVSSTNVPMLLLGMLIAGFGYCTLMPATMMTIGLVTPADSVAFATSLMMAIMNVTSFLASAWMGLIGNITGDAVYMPVYIGIAGFIVLAVLMAIKKPVPAPAVEN